VGVTPVVRLGRADGGELLTLQRAAYVTEAQLHDDVRLPPLLQTLGELAAELADPAVIALGVREAGRLVAAVRLRVVDEGVLELGRLAVAPDRQGAGLGTLLLLESERAVPGTRRIDLFTGELSAGNLRLYQRHGYVETRRTPAGNHALVHLTKTLPALPFPGQRAAGPQLEGLP
jgi:GNAT superfamily N-acetyltransferase